MEKPSLTFSPTTRLWRSYARPASRSLAARSLSIVKQCGFRPRCNAGGTSRPPPPELVTCWRIDVCNGGTNLKRDPVSGAAAFCRAHARRRGMSFRVSGKNLDVGAALRERITTRVDDATSKYFNGGYSGHATVGKDGFGFKTECALHLDSGITLEAEGMAADAYASADQAAIRIEKRLRRYKRKLKDHKSADVPR